MNPLESAVEKLEGKAEKAKEAKSSGTPWGWLVALIVGIVVAIGAALLMWKLGKKNEELAKLRTKIEQDEVAAANAKFKARIAQLRGEGAPLMAEAKALQTRVMIAKLQLKKEEENHVQMVERIMAAKNWDELNALVRK